MKVELKGYDCPYHDPIDEWLPKDQDNFHYQLTLQIGPQDEIGADLFQANIISPNLKHKYEYQSRSIVVHPYSFSDVLKGINTILQGINEKSWQMCAKKLNTIFEWEFDTYKQL